MFSWSQTSLLHRRSTPGFYGERMRRRLRAGAAVEDLRACCPYYYAVAGQLVAAHAIASAAGADSGAGPLDDSLPAFAMQTFQTRYKVCLLVLALGQREIDLSHWFAAADCISCVCSGTGAAPLQTCSPLRNALHGLHTDGERVVSPALARRPSQPATRSVLVRCEWINGPWAQELLTKGGSKSDASSDALTLAQRLSCEEDALFQVRL